MKSADTDEIVGRIKKKTRSPHSMPLINLDGSLEVRHFGAVPTGDKLNSLCGTGKGLFANFLPKLFEI